MDLTQPAQGQEGTGAGQAVVQQHRDHLVEVRVVGLEVGRGKKDVEGAGTGWLGGGDCLVPAQQLHLVRTGSGAVVEILEEGAGAHCSLLISCLLLLLPPPPQAVLEQGAH